MIREGAVGARVHILPGESVFRAAQEIAKRRTEMLDKMKVALESGKDLEALNLARELCGIRVETASQKTRVQ